MLSMGTGDPRRSKFSGCRKHQHQFMDGDNVHDLHRQAAGSQFKPILQFSQRQRRSNAFQGLVLRVFEMRPEAHGSRFLATRNEKSIYAASGPAYQPRLAVLAAKTCASRCNVRDEAIPRSAATPRSSCLLHTCDICTFIASSIFSLDV